MRWNKGFTGAAALAVVDHSTWADRPGAELLSGKVNRDSDSELIESATLSTRHRIGEGEHWVRIYLTATQSGSAERTAVFTGLMSVPSDSVEGVNRISGSLECYSVLKPAKDVKLPLGYYVGKGASAAGAAAKLLSVGPAPVIIEGDSPKLSDYIVADSGETNLSMAQTILSTIGWCIRISGDGTIALRAESDEEKLVMGPTTEDIVTFPIREQTDRFNCPNVLRVISGSESYVAMDLREDSPLSVYNLGREIWAEETSITLAAGETLALYAERRLRELQAYATTWSYTRRFWPDITPGDVLRINYNGFGVAGRVRVKSQTIDLTGNGRTQEEVAVL